MTTRGATATIARFVAGTPGDAIPPDVRRSAVNTMIDTYATATAGIVEEASKVIRAFALDTTAPGRSRVLGSDRTADPAAAALANGAAAHALDYDTVSVAVSGFVGSAMATSLAAWVETMGPQSGRDVVTAYCLGWEATAAIARGVNMWHYAHGWHPTATLSNFAATLAVGRLAGLDEQGLRMAIGVAVAEASGVKTMIGNMLNPYHVGKAARNGINAVRLVREGFQAHPSAIEAPQGFLNVFNGTGNYDLEAIVGSVGSEWDLIGLGPIFKMYPCCALIHTGIDCALALRSEHDIRPDEIERVTIRFHEYIPAVMHVDVPTHGYAAKFSVPYCLAAAFQDGRVDLATFDAVDPAIVKLGERVRAEVHPDLYGAGSFMKNEFSELEVVTKRGTFTRRIDRMRNRGTGRYLSEADLRAKLADCVRHSQLALDASRQWERLSAMDCERPFDLWGEP